MSDHPYDDLGSPVHRSDLEAHLHHAHAMSAKQLDGATEAVMAEMHAQEHMPALPPNAFEVHAGMLDHMGGILELVKGYKQKCMDAGFEESAAELMAVHLHQAVLFRMGTVTLEVVGDGS